MTNILLATRNRNKLREANRILHGLIARRVIHPDGDVTFISLSDVGFEGEIEETGATFEENALIKARAVSKYGYITMADDSGLCVDALGGRPGIYSSRYSGGNDEDNNDLLLRELEGHDDRGARYECAVACVMPDGTEFTETGICTGTILRERKGTGGFGYDPLFRSDDLGTTFAVASPEEKNSVSHRFKAFRAALIRIFPEKREI